MPNLAHSRRDPQKGKNGFSTSKGFTLIEVMIAVAVSAIVMSLALPSYRTIIEKRATSSAAQQAKAFMTVAQLTSVKRNQYVAVNFEKWGDNWCLGVASADTPNVSCDCHTGNDCTIDGELMTIQSSSLNHPDVLSSASVGGIDNILVFDPVRGLILGGETASIQLISPDGSSYALNVNVNATGRTKICSDADRSDYDHPGYESC